MPSTPLPRRPAPPLSFPLLGGGNWALSEQTPDHFSLVVFYRGLHCPVCRSYLKTLEQVRPDYAALGVTVVAVSMDNEVRARKARMDWELGDLTLGYGLDETTARAWGLFLSEAVKSGEPDVFSEPGLFLVRPDGTLYYDAVNSAPWGRPHLPTFLKAVEFIIGADYPARGEFADAARDRS